MNELAKMRWAFAGLPLAGMASALMTIYMYSYHYPYPYVRYLRYGNPLGSGVFGVSLAVVFWLFLGLHSFWKTAVFIAASIAAAYLAFLSAVLVTGRLFASGPPYKGGFFVGGLVGGFVLVAAALFLLFPKPKVWRVVVKAACWSLAGGLLGVIGNASGDLFGRIRPHLAFVPVQQTNSDISLILVWQTGMGLVLALALWSKARRLQAGSAVG